jgi:hypothetical protein
MPPSEAARERRSASSMSASCSFILIQAARCDQRLASAGSRESSICATLGGKIQRKTKPHGSISAKQNPETPLRLQTMAIGGAVRRTLRPAATRAAVLRQAARSCNSIGSTSYAAALATQKAAKMSRDLISDDDMSIKNFTLNFGPQARPARGRGTRVRVRVGLAAGLPPVARSARRRWPLRRG